MREIEAQEIEKRVKEAILEINYHTPEGKLKRLREALESEPSEAGRAALRDIIANREIASQEKVPMCQDTGMAIVFVELGDRVRVVGGSLKRAIMEGVKEGYRPLRKSVVEEPLFERRNTKDNTPPIVHIDLVEGDRLKLLIGAKGFGAENMSSVRLLTPAAGIEGVKREVLRVVEEAGPNACPPVVVGVGLGGDLEVAAMLAKRALLRPMGSRNPDPRYAALEDELLELINKTGIGPQGLGGRNTALDVRIEYYPTHIAAIPIAVNLDCHLQRHKEIIL